MDSDGHVERRGMEKGNRWWQYLEYNFFNAEPQRVLPAIGPDRGRRRKVQIQLLPGCARHVVEEIAQVVGRLELDLAVGARGHWGCGGSEG